MAVVKTFFEMTQQEAQTRPFVAQFAPFDNVRILRTGWRQWFWLGDSMESNHRLMIGPFKRKGLAKRAWQPVAESKEIRAERFDPFEDSQ